MGQRVGSHATPARLRAPPYSVVDFAIFAFTPYLQRFICIFTDTNVRFGLLATQIQQPSTHSNLVFDPVQTHLRDLPSTPSAPDSANRLAKMRLAYLVSGTQQAAPACSARRRSTACAPVSSSGVARLAAAAAAPRPAAARLARFAPSVIVPFAAAAAATVHQEQPQQQLPALTEDEAFDLADTLLPRLKAAAPRFFAERLRLFQRRTLVAGMSGELERRAR